MDEKSFHDQVGAVLEEAAAEAGLTVERDVTFSVTHKGKTATVSRRQVKEARDRGVDGRQKHLDEQECRDLELLDAIEAKAENRGAASVYAKAGQVLKARISELELEPDVPYRVSDEYVITIRQRPRDGYEVDPGETTRIEITG